MCLQFLNISLFHRNYYIGKLTTQFACIFKYKILKNTNCKTQNVFEDDVEIFCRRISSIYFIIIINMKLNKKKKTSADDQKLSGLHVRH